MAYVIGEPCLVEGPACGQCVTVCPTEAIHGGKGYAYVDAVYCIECGACVTVCEHHNIYSTEPIFGKGNYMPLVPYRHEYITLLNEALAERNSTD